MQFVVANKNSEIKNKKVENYTDLVKYINLSDIIDKFKMENIKINGVGNIIDNFKNIIINKVKIKKRIEN